MVTDAERWPHLSPGDRQIVRVGLEIGKALACVQPGALQNSQLRICWLHLLDPIYGAWGGWRPGEEVPMLVWPCNRDALIRA